MTNEGCRHINAVSDVKQPQQRICEPGERWLYCYPDDAFAEY